MASQTAAFALHFGSRPLLNSRLRRDADGLPLFTFDVLPPQPFDCMLEAKEKDRPLLRLRADLRRHGIIEADLGAPARHRTLRRVRPA